MAELALQSVRWPFERRCLLSSECVDVIASRPCLSCRTRRISFSRCDEIRQVHYKYRADGGIEYWEEYPTYITWWIVLLFIVPNVIGSVTFLVGSVYASKASRNWGESEFCNNPGEGGSCPEVLPEALPEALPV